MNNLLYKLSIFIAVVTMPLFQSPLMADDLGTSLKDFQQKLLKTKDDSRGMAPYASIALQIKLIESQLSRGGYDRAEQQISNINVNGMPPELQQEWIERGRGQVSFLD